MFKFKSENKNVHIYEVLIPTNKEQFIKRLTRGAWNMSKANLFLESTSSKSTRENKIIILNERGNSQSRRRILHLDHGCRCAALALIDPSRPDNPLH